MRQRYRKLSAAVFFALAAVAVSLGQQAEPAAAAEFGSLIRGTSHPAVYYYADDGKRYSFPNERTFFTWYTSFKGVQVISDGELASIPLGGNVTHKPGARMVKIVSDPKVYAVDKGGLLRWVRTEAVARSLYGADWNRKIDDIPAALFVNYTLGDPIGQSAEFSPSYAQIETPDIDYDREYRLGIRSREAWAERSHLLYCGDGVCTYGELAGSCPADCGGSAGEATAEDICGDGACTRGESCSSCASDCGACAPVCGNAVCETAENAHSCPEDCLEEEPEPEAVVAVCSNGICEEGEDSESCWADCPYDFGDWRDRLDALDIPSIETGVADDGLYFLKSGDFEVRVPTEEAYDYAKYRVYNLMRCQEQIREILGREPHRFSALRAKSLVGMSDRSVSTITADGWILNYSVTEDVFRDATIGDDAFWKSSSLDWDICVGGHEEVHIFSYAIWPFEEGLATYIHDIFWGLRGGTERKIQECRDDGYVLSYEDFVPYAILDYRFGVVPIQRYHTSACFWKHIDDTYGRGTLQTIFANMSDERADIYATVPSFYDMGVEQIERSVVPVVGEEIWSFVGNMLERRP